MKSGNRWVQDAFDSKGDGTFSIDSLAPGKYSLEPLPPQAELAKLTAEKVELTVEAGKTQSGVRIELTKGGVLEIAITDAIDGKPVENASVTVLHKLGGQGGYGLSGKDGVIRIRLMPGDYYLLNGVYKQGYSPQGAEESFTIADGKTERLEYSIFPDSTIKGIVRDEKGRPLESATLMVWPSLMPQETVANGEGKFAVAYKTQNLSDDELQVPTLLICRHKSSNLASALEIDAGTSTLDVTLKPGMIFTGHVVDPDGKGIEGVKLRVELRTPGLNWPIVPMNPTRYEAAADEDGKFEIKAVPAGQKYNLLIEAQGYGNKHLEEINTGDAADNRFDLGNVILALANLSVSGVVVDEAGKPAAGAIVNIYSSSQPYHVTRTDKDGRFTFEGVCAGRIQILAHKPGTELHGAIYTDGGMTDVRIVLSRNLPPPSYVPKQPDSLVGKSPPVLKELGIDLLPADTDGKMLLVCFFDMNQRPSRNCLKQLSVKAQELKEKGIIVVAVQASKVDQSELDEWLKKYNVPFSVGMIQGDAEKTRFNWGVKSLPWLILTDSGHIVRAEGFALTELDEELGHLGDK